MTCVGIGAFRTIADDDSFVVQVFDVTNFYSAEDNRNDYYMIL